MYRYKHTNQSRHICNGVGALSPENIFATLINTIEWSSLLINQSLLWSTVIKSTYLIVIKIWFIQRKKQWLNSFNLRVFISSRWKKSIDIVQSNENISNKGDKGDKGASSHMHTRFICVYERMKKCLQWNNFIRAIYRSSIKVLFTVYHTETIPPFPPYHFRPFFCENEPSL